LTLPDVRRCLIIGYSGQNPYLAPRYSSKGSDSNPFAGMDKKLREEEASRAYWAKKQAEGVSGERGKLNIEANIKAVIQRNEDEERQRLLSAPKEDV
jgi:hypothetical protein